MSRHARPGETIQVKNVNNAYWVDVGEIYEVESVGSDMGEKYSYCYRLKDVKSSWWASPEHFDILGTKGDAHPELIAEAARRYPKGTHYLDVGSGAFGDKYESRGSTPEVYDYHKSKPRIKVQDGGGIVYMDCVWAPIVHRTYQLFDKGDFVVRWRDVENWEWNNIGSVTLPPIGHECQVTAVKKCDRLNKLPSIELDEEWWYPATAFIFSDYYNPSITNRGTAELNTTDHGKINQGRIIEVQRPIASIVTGQGRTGSRVQGRRDAAVIGRGHLGYKTITGR